MNASSMSSQLAIRLPCGMLLVMALLDVPVAVEPSTAKWFGALLLAGVIGTLAALAWRRQRSEDPRGRRKGNLVATATR
jgi:hypothetical protein